ncbi:MAG TPA: hypothetical protein VEZ90_08600, partial [Blastocatellia bacterium]|nr:hypothetical protein [Blastocatellia bacterium]
TVACVLTICTPFEGAAETFHISVLVLSGAVLLLGIVTANHYIVIPLVKRYVFFKRFRRQTEDFIRDWYSAYFKCRLSLLGIPDAYSTVAFPLRRVAAN